MDNKPAPVTRGALERVLARASELQTAAGDAPESDAMTEAQIIDVAKEVGLSPEHVRQALAEERARGEPDAEADSFVMTLLGRRRVAAQRVVPGEPDQVLAALDRWMQNEEWMSVKRQQRDRLTWEPRQDFIAGIRRAFGSKTHTLHFATDVAATVVGVESGRSLVALTADLSGRRSALVMQTVAISGFGLAASVVLGVLGFMTIATIAPVAIATPLAAYGAQRAMTSALARAQLALEQVLDRLERRPTDTRPPSFFQMIDSALPRLR